MKLGTEVLELGEAVNRLICDIVILQRTDADAVKPVAAGKLYGVNKGTANVQTVAGEVDTDEHHFTEAGGLYALELGINALHGAGAGPAARGGNNAVGTVTVAAVLNFNDGAGSALKLFDAGIFKILCAVVVLFHVKNPGALLRLGNELLDVLQNLSVVPVTDYNICGLQVHSLFWKRLRHASCEHDNGARHTALETANGLAGLVVTDRGNGTGVDNDGLTSFRRIPDRPAMRAEHFLHALCVIRIHFAPERVKIDIHSNLL